VPYLSASAVVIHYEEALYQVYAPLPLPFYAGFLSVCVCVAGLWWWPAWTSVEQWSQ